MALPFDAYGFLAYVVPGAAFLFILMIMFPKLNWVLGREKVELGGFGVFLIVAFVLGQLLQNLGAVIKQGPYNWQFKTAYATNLVVLPGSMPLLSLADARLLKDKALKKFEVDIANIHLSDAMEAMTWRNVVLRIINLVHCSGDNERSEVCVRRTERLEIYNRNHGLHLGLTAAFSLLFLVMAVVSAIQFRVPGWRMAWDCNSWILGPVRSPVALLLLALAAYIAYDRMSYFDQLYARELFLVFLSLPEPAPVL